VFVHIVRFKSGPPAAVLLPLLCATLLPAPSGTRTWLVARPSDTTSVVLLGTGMPRPNPDASGPATAILVSNRVFLVDAGAGVMRQLAAAHLPINGVTALFLTHLHSDHTLGYPDLILTSWVMGRRAPLEAYGPHGLQRMTQGILDTWSEDIQIRITGLERESPTGYQVQVHEIDPGVVYDSAGVRVTAIRVKHGNWPEALAYRFDTPDRSITISGDTRPSEDLARAAAGTDVLIHEAYPASRAAPEPRPGGESWPQYMREFHTSDVELGALAARIQPRLLILYHIVRMGAADEEILAGVRRGGFAGRVVIGKDLDRY
jgi:ribonuclease Z